MSGFQLGLNYLEQLPPIVREELEQLVASIQAALGEQSDLFNEISSAIQVGTLAEAPPGLGSADAGFRYRVTDYGHEVVWSGTVWEFAPGDVGNGFYRPFAVAPQEAGWQLCDGTVTTRLVLGAALTTASFTTPTLADQTFLKHLAVHTGSVDAAVAPTLSGKTADIGISGGVADDMDIFGFSAAPTGTNVVAGISKFTHKHGVGTLVASSGGRPASLGAMIYFRR